MNVINLLISKTYIFPIKPKVFEKLLSPYYSFLDPSCFWCKYVNNYLVIDIDPSVFSDPWEMSDHGWAIENLIKDLEKSQKGTKHYKYSFEGRMKISEEYYKNKLQITDQDKWAYTHYEITGRTLRAILKEFPE